MRQKVLRLEVLVEHRGDEERGGELRHGAQEEDADGVEDRVPEELVAQHGGEVGEAHPFARALEQVPFAQRDHEGEDQREQTDQPEEQEERRHVEVGRRLDVEAGEPLFAGQAWVVVGGRSGGSSLSRSRPPAQGCGAGGLRVERVT